MTPTHRRQLLLFCLIGLALAAPLAWEYFWPGDALHDITGHQYGRDFINVWGGARLALRGDVMMLFDYEAYFRALQALYGAEIPFHNWSYPPHILPLIAGFATLPYFPALALWTFGGFAIYVAVVVSRVAPDARIATMGLLLLAPSTLVNAVTGQNGFFTAALFLGAVATMERRPWLAGVLLGLLSVKPHLGLAIGAALLALAAWRTIAAAVVTTALMVGASIALWGVEPWVGFISKTTVMTRFYFDHFQGFYTYMMPSVFASARLVGLSMTAATAVQGVVSVGVIAVTTLAVRRTQDTALRALLIAAATLLVSPYAFNYDMTLLTGALVWFMVGSTVTERERWIVGAAWVLPVLIWPLHLWRVGIAPLLIGAVFALAVTHILSAAPTVRESSRSEVAA